MGNMKKHDFFFQGKYVYNVYERRIVSVVFLFPQILLDCKNVETTQFSCVFFYRNRHVFCPSKFIIPTNVKNSNTFLVSTCWIFFSCSCSLF